MLNRKWFLFAACCLLLLLSACGQKEIKRAEPPASIPAAQSSLMGGFIWQEDGTYAYAALRPASWQAKDKNNRIFFPPDASDPPATSLTVINLSVYEKNGMDQFYIEPWELFKQNPNFSGWIKAMERSWQQSGAGANIERIQDLEQAAVYALRGEGGYLRLTAFAVDQGQPLLVVFDTQGEMADLGRLREDGIYADFLTLVSSIRAAPYQPGISSPLLKDE